MDKAKKVGEVVDTSPEISVNEEEIKVNKKLYYAVEAFYDSVSKTYYPVGALYYETSDERTAALLKDEKSDLNKIGRKFIQEGK